MNRIIINNLNNNINCNFNINYDDGIIKFKYDNYNEIIYSYNEAKNIIEYCFNGNEKILKLNLISGNPYIPDINLNNNFDSDIEFSEDEDNSDLS